MQGFLFFFKVVGYSLSSKSREDMGSKVLGSNLTSLLT